MKVFRYDHVDGGGPFMTKDGFLRSNKNIHLDDGYLSCCLSLDGLNKWFNQRKINLSDCYINTYEIPEKEIIKSATHFYFPKKYKKETRNEL